MKVRTYVHVRSADKTRTAVLRPGDTVPDWATVTLRTALADPEPAAEPEQESPAPEPEVPAAEPEPAPAAPVTKRATRPKKASPAS